MPCGIGGPRTCFDFDDFNLLVMHTSEISYTCTCISLLKKKNVKNKNLKISKKPPNTYGLFGQNAMNQPQ